MRPSLVSCSLGILGLLFVAPLASSDEPAKDTRGDIKVVNYAGLSEFIKQQRGKVVVVDFWSDTCVPCKKEFPNLVKLNKDLARDGFVAVSVSTDDPADKETMERVQKFLVKQDAKFANFVLDEKPEVWQKRLGFEAVPCVFVFNKAGEWQKFDGAALADGGYERIRERVVELLKK